MPGFDDKFLQYFSSSYEEAREKFLSAAEAAGTEVTSIRHPESGPEGEALYLDAALAGRRDARQLFVLVSGTHGPEGYCGSACQTGLLNQWSGARRPSDVAVLLLHAHNPYGFAWGVRQTQEKIDLNRNFVDHGRPPENALCDRFYRLLGEFPAEWSEEFFERFQAAKTALLDEYSAEEIEKWIGYGQYKYPDGLHFGGFSPSWSNRAFSRLLTEHAAAAHRVVLIDVHTGLGRYGYGELLSVDPPQSDEFLLSRELFGNTVQSMPGGTAAASYSEGNVSAGARKLLPHATVVAHALEFGTYEGAQLQPTKIRCQWLLAKDRLGTPGGELVRRAYRAIFYPEYDDWKELVWSRAMMACRQAIQWLARPDVEAACRPEGAADFLSAGERRTL